MRRRTAPGLMTDVDRAYRARYLQARQISPKDQSYHFFHLWDNPEFRKARLNPLRRLWQAPGEMFEHALRPMMGMRRAFVTKWLVGKALWGLGATWAVSYYFLYNRSDWTRAGGWKVISSKPMTGPNNPHFPKPDPKYIRSKPSDYASYEINRDPQAVGQSSSIPVTW